jgi:hypothetical protein
VLLLDRDSYLATRGYLRILGGGMLGLSLVT